jgi:hypothetical protein
MRQTVLVILVLAAGLAATGCYGQVQRTITIESEPPGAIVWLNDNEVGRTPITVPFTWYGIYGVRLEAPGYETLITTAPVKTPTYEWIPLDLLSETVVPGIKHDDHSFRYALKKAEPVDTEALRQRAEALRREGTTPVP